MPFIHFQHIQIRLDETQEMEERQLKEQLNQEMELLNVFQNKTRQQAERQRIRERSELEERVKIREQLLEKKVNVEFFQWFFLTSTKFQMESERQQFQDERNERKRLLLERQAQEIKDFDLESTRMGFNALSIADASTNESFQGSSYLDNSDADELSIRGSMLSLTHSNSAQSFTHTAL